MKKRYVALVGIAGVVLVAAVASAASSGDPNTVSADATTGSSSSTSAQAAQAPAAKSNVKITKFKTDDTLGITNIEGTFQNDGDAKSYVQIEGVLLDKDGNQVDTFLTNTTNLAAGKLWKWKTSAFTTDAVKAQVKDVSSY